MWSIKQTISLIGLKCHRDIATSTYIHTLTLHQCISQFRRAEKKILMSLLPSFLVGRVLTLKTERRFTLHHVNSYELDENTIVVDYITYPDVLVLKNLRLNIIRDPKKRDKLSPNKCRIRRYTLHLNNQTVVPSKLGNKRGLQFLNHFDMPAINENYQYKKYCVIYGLAMKSDDVSFSRFKLIKKNVCDSRKDMYWERRNHYPSEPTFIPRPSAVHEDDGVVISIILDGRRGQSYVGIFDPKTMQLVSKAYLPTVVPFLFHGRHFD